MNNSLTDYELAQLRNILADNPHRALCALRECAELAGLVSKADYSRIMCVPLRTVQYACKQGKLEGQVISGEFFPAVNCNL